MILSTGGATMPDVQRAHDILRSEGADVAVLQCTAGYPAAWEELDLRVIDAYRSEFPASVIGLSSHDNGIAMPLAAYMLGARVVEKHFTLDRAMRGSDHSFSLEPQGLQKLVRDLRRARVALGDGQKKVYASEKQSLVKMAKKLVAAEDLAEGHVLGAGSIAVKSPGDGVPPSEFDRFVGARLNRAVGRDEPLSFEMLAETGDAAPVDEMPALAEVDADERGEQPIADSVLSA
jgi:N-acetylneuraminate synthase/sialic acid synthase